MLNYYLILESLKQYKNILLDYIEDIECTINNEVDSDSIIKLEKAIEDCNCEIKLIDVEIKKITEEEVG